MTFHDAGANFAVNNPPSMEILEIGVGATTFGQSLVLTAFRLG